LRRRGVCGQCWCSGGIVALDQLNIVGREETTLALRVCAHPPVVVYHVDVCDILAFTELDFVVLRLFVVILDDCALAGATGTGIVIVMRSDRCADGSTAYCGSTKSGSSNGSASSTSRVLGLDLWLWRHVTILPGCLIK